MVHGQTNIKRLNILNFLEKKIYLCIPYVFHKSTINIPLNNIIGLGLKVKGRFMGFFQNCSHSAYCILTPNNFPHSSPEAPRIIQMRETSTNEGGNYYQ